MSVSLHSIAPDDVVETLADVQPGMRPPLLVLEPLMEFLDTCGIGSGAIEASTVGDGHSNVTFLIQRGGTEVILRRPPRPPWPPSAHDVLREARVLQALEGRAAVPRVLAVCPDIAVLGVPFYVMERVHGVVLTSAVPPFLDTLQDRRLVGEQLVDALVELHAVDRDACGLADFGRPTGYLERQLRRFSSLWEINKTREVGAVERLADWLRRNMPESPPATIVHGDFRVGNVIYASSSPARLAAILDWEMATTGDPLADLGYLTYIWVDKHDPVGPYESVGFTRAEGFLTRGELIARYEQGSGRATTDLRWYQVLAGWKSIVFMEGNYKRAAVGATDDPFLRQFGESVPVLAAWAEEIAFGQGLAT
jgi:aminoglycoside phosphotransferase (APT) family kinase protein